MEDTPCSELIQILKERYIVENLDAFLAADANTNEGFFQIEILNKETQELLASIATSIRDDEKEIHVGFVMRVNRENKRSKGLGKVLMYIVVCKALQMGYKVSFSAADDGLLPYYNSLGFQRSNEEKSLYVTAPTPIQFHPKIQETINSLKAKSRGGRRKKRALKTRRKIKR